jgi:uncharacterized membrane protein YcaP (DUF421 family)
VGQIRCARGAIYARERNLHRINAARERCSRRPAINGSGPFFATLAGSFVIVLLHRLLARLVYQWPSLNRLIKGRPVVLLRDGQFQAEGMHALLVTREDIEEDMRLEARVENPQAIKLARLGPSGDISFILKETE